MKNAFRNWSDVRVFLAVVRAGSTLAASRTLGIAQPTVARRIDALEHALGLTLFERETRGFRPTGAARALVPAAEEIERAALAFARQAGDFTGPKTIRVTAFSSNFSPRANRIFAEFTAEHPEVDFEFLPGVQVLDLSAGEADVALRLTRSEPDETLIRRKISTARFALYAAPSYIDLHGAPKSLDDLRRHRFVSFRREGVNPAFDDWLTSHVPKENILTTYTEVDLLSAAIRAGRGLGFINVRLAESEGDLVQCLPPPAELDAEHLLLVSPDAWRRPEVKDFVRFFAPRYARLYK